jgi:predicted MFS family arabinose efflux permease
MNAISLNNSSMNLTRVAGPALAGLLILMVDTAGVFFLVSGIYVMSAFSIMFIRTKTHKNSPSQNSVLDDVKEGLAYALEEPKLKGLFTLTFIAVLFGFSYYALIPAWAREALLIQSDGLGLLLMLMGIGATIGTIILAARGDFSKKGLMLLSASAAWGISLAVFAQVTTFLLAIPFLIFIGFTSSTFMSMNMTMIQLSAKNEMRGRIMSISMMTFGLMPLSAVPFGIIAETIGTPNALTISGILLAISTMIFATFNKTLRNL